MSRSVINLAAAAKAELMGAIADLEVKPGLFVMENYFLERWCGTACCLAGQIAIRAGGVPRFSNGPATAFVDFPPGARGLPVESRDAGRVAEHILGLNNVTAATLFNPHQWCYEAKARYLRGNSKGDHTEMIAALRQQVVYLFGDIWAQAAM